MGDGILPAQGIADLIRDGAIRFNEKVDKRENHPFSQQITQSQASKLKGPWQHVTTCTLNLPGTDRVYASSESRPPFDGETLEEYLRGSSDHQLQPIDGGYRLKPNSIFRIVFEPTCNLEGLTGTVTNPSSYARSTILVNIVAPSPTIKQIGYNVVPDGFQGQLVAEVRTGDHGYLYKVGDCLAQSRFATHPDQSTYTLDRKAIQALYGAIGPRGLLNTPDGKPIPFHELNVSEDGSIPIAGDLGPKSRMLIAHDSGNEFLELYNPKDPELFFRKLVSKPVGKSKADKPGNYELSVPPYAFVLFQTLPRIAIPPWLAGSLSEHDTRYTRGAVHSNADFINSGHGWNKADDGGYGGRMTLEYETESHRSTLRHGRPFVNLKYLLLTEPTNLVYDGEHNAVTSLLPKKFFDV